VNIENERNQKLDVKEQKDKIRQMIESNEKVYSK